MQGHSAACTRSASLRVALRCDPGEVRDALRSVREFLASHFWTSGQLMSFDLALVESCNNAIKYADGEGRKQPVEISVNCDADEVEFRIHDHTPGFEWPRSFKLPRADSESGRGLFLINSLMDYANYFRGRDGNILIMRKKRSPENRATALAEMGRANHLPEQFIQNEVVLREMMDELNSCYECLSVIFRYGAEPIATGNLRDFAQRLFTDLQRIISAEWFVMRLAANDKSYLKVLAASESLFQLDAFGFADDSKPPHPAEMETARVGKRVWFEPSTNDADSWPSPKSQTDSAGLVHPIRLGDELIGTVALGKRCAETNNSTTDATAVFTAAQTHVVEMFADFLATHIAKGRTQEEQVNRRLVNHELEIAKNIQRSLLPANLPQLAGFTLAGFCRSAHAVGGDFYDVLTVDDHSLLLVIADVMGKGIPAAMFAAILRSLLRISPELASQPAALLTRVNRQLYPELSGVEMFITAQLAYVDARARKMVAASAGHCPLAVADAREVQTFSPEGMPLGILPDTTFHEVTADLPPQCRVLLFTDGLSDALNVKRQHFTQQRLMDWLQRSTGDSCTAEELKHALARELDTHQMNASLYDDQTFLILAG